MINWLKKITLLLLVFAAMEVTGQSLQLISPAGGETWNGASEQTITWNYLNVDNIQIQYSLDSGLTWVTIIDSLPSSAFTYTWKVPSISSTTARVRITSILNFTQSTSGIFTIPDPTIQLLFPTNGVQIDASSGQYVAWDATGIDTVGIDYSLDNGATWSFLSYAQGYDGYANWVIPDTLTNQARLRVYNIGDTVTADTSGAYSITSPTLKDTAKYFGGNYDGYSFSNNLPNSLTILKANGGERLIPATIDTISWTSNNIDRINIEYSINNGRTWVLLDSNISTQQLFYTWQVPNTPSDSCLLKLTSTIPGFQTISDSLWHIEPTNIEVLFPNGNENLAATSGQYIQWVADGVNTVKLEFSADNGMSWNLIDTAAGINGYANWIIPNTIGPNYLVRVSDNSDSTVVDTSDQTFEVINLFPIDSAKYYGGAFDGYSQANNDTSSITVISPNGNETWFSATTETIVWNFNNATSVTIEVTYDDGLSWDTLAENIPASQLEYDWYIPSTPSSLCRIRITDVAVGLTDVSDDPFIIPSPNIAITYPNGGEVFEAGSGQYIQWTNADVDSIKLEYSADNGANWSVIGVAPGIHKFANWVVPQVASNQLKIRATDITNPLYTDTSNFSFSSVMPNQLTANKYHGGVFDGYSYYRYFDDYVQIIAANGGEIWGNGTLQTVEWATLNTFENINLEITTDNGVTWDTLLQNVPNNPKTWNWLINEPISSTCKLRISTVSGALIDQSDDFFTIANTVGITTASVSNSSYCSTDTIQVNFSLGATFLPGNSFIVQLSDSTGSFNGQVVNIGQVTSNSAQTITATLPETYDYSDDYRVRVIATNPPTIGSDNGLDFAINPLPTVQLGNDTIICNGDSVQLTAVAQNASSFIWSTGDTSSSIMITQPGTYSVIASNSCGDNFDTIRVNSLIAPTLSLGNDTLVCVNTPVTFNAGTSSDQFLWSTGSTDSVITTAVPGMYTATLSNACFSTSDTVILSNKPQIAVNLGNNQGLCNGQSTVLDATNTGANYVWSTGDTTSSINVNSAGSYWVQVSNECQSVSDQVVIIDGDISLNLADTLQICNGSTETIIARGANYYAWSNGSTTNSITVSPTVSTTYTVTATNVYNCSSTADVYVEVINQLFTYDTIISATPYTWSVTGLTYNLSGIYSDTSINSSGCELVKVLNLTVTQPCTSTFTDLQTACDSYTWIDGITYTASTTTPTFTLTNAVGCDSIITLNLTINSLPSISLAQDTVFSCGQDSLQLDAGVGFSSYTWSSGDITRNPYVSSTGLYTITVTNSNGCSATDSIYASIINAKIAQEDTAFCIGDSLTLSVFESANSQSITNSMLVVPVAYSSIQSAIDNASNGDTIYVKNGVYYENINFNGKSLTLLGENKFATVLDGSNGNSSVVHLDGSSTISHFTISNGKGTIRNLSDKFGGGIYAPSGTNQINNCIFKDNNLDLTIDSRGGGVFTNANTTINNSHFLNNSVQQHGAAVVGGIIKNCLFENNINGNGTIFQSVAVYNSIIRNNPSGGITYSSLPNVIINNTLIYNNSYGIKPVNSTATQVLNSSIYANTNQQGVPNNIIFGSNGPSAYSIISVDSSFIEGDSLLNPNTQFGEIIWGPVLLTSPSSFSTGLLSNLTYNWSTGDTTATINAAPTQTTTYYVTIADGVGSCTDSVTVTVKNNTGTDIQTACDSYTWIDGITYTASTSSPTFTLTNAAGCDSVVTLNLTINNSNIGTDIQSVCDTYTWIDGITYTASTSTPTFTLSNVAGCDSVVTLNLTINNSNTGTDSQTACDSYTWIDGITYTASASTPTFTLTNAAGCDSIVTLNLTINNSSTGTDIQTACDSYTWIDGITYTASTSSPTFTLTNTAGCDSVVTLNLTINNSSISSSAVTACDSYLWLQNNVTYTTSGAYTDTIANAVGCDSVITLNLTINNSSASSSTVTACDSYIWLQNNVTYTTSGAYTDTIANTVGCDSIVKLFLVIDTLNLSLSNINDSLVSNDATVASYQWINCDSNNAIIAGATNQGYQPTMSGNYAVILTKGACADTSACENLIISNTIENKLNANFSLFPNPTNGEFVLRGNGYSTSEILISVMDMNGRVIESRIVNANSNSINERFDLSNQANGVYFISIQSEGKVEVKKVVLTGR